MVFAMYNLLIAPSFIKKKNNVQPSFSIKNLKQEQNLTITYE